MAEADWRESHMRRSIAGRAVGHVEPIGSSSGSIHAVHYASAAGDISFGGYLGRFDDVATRNWTERSDWLEVNIRGHVGPQKRHVGRGSLLPSFASSDGRFLLYLRLLRLCTGPVYFDLIFNSLFCLKLRIGLRFPSSMHRQV